MTPVKTYVLDTNVLIHDPEALFKFEEHRVVIPITVVEELDGLKKDSREVGRNARQSLRLLDKLIEEGRVGSGIPVNDQGGIVEILLLDRLVKLVLPEELEWTVADNRILGVAKQTEGILVSKDTNIRIKASALGVPAQNYENDKVSYVDLYTGHQDAYISEDALNLLYSEGFLNRDQARLFECFPNEFITFHSIDEPKHSAIARWDKGHELFVLVSGSVLKPSGLMPKNTEQLLALDALMNPDIKLVTLVGVAGTGKTLCALAAALQCQDNGDYDKILVARPVVPMGNDIGYLPGSEQEKLAPWMAPIRDSISFLMGESIRRSRKEVKKEDKKVSKSTKPGKIIKALEKEYYDKDEKDAGKLPGMDELQAHGLLELCTLTYMRGRSIPNQYIIVDEGQNCTPHEMKTILTRAGEGTKIVITGDPEQIDTPYLDASSNGLSYVVEKFRGEKIAAHVTLTKGERSELAEIAARVL
jgi:PhoH-like ATPase